MSVCVCLPAQPVQLNVYPVKSLMRLFLWGALLKIQRLFNRDEISFALISSGWQKNKIHAELKLCTFRMNVLAVPFMDVGGLRGGTIIKL